jgi:hypothetical protein
MSEIDINQKFEEMQTLAITEPTHCNMQRYLLLGIYKFAPALQGLDIYKMKWYRDGVKAPYIKLDDKILKLKSGAEITLSDDLIEIFESVKEFIESDYVFANMNNYKKCRSTSGHTKFMNEIFGKNVSSRKIRKAYITSLIKKGMTIKEIAKETKLTARQVLAAINISDLVKQQPAE